MTVVVAERLVRPHPLVVKTRDVAKTVKPDESGRLDLGGGVAARLHVSRDVLPRALRLLDALCKAAALRGWRTEAGRRHSGTPCTKFICGSWDVEFKISEIATKTPHVRTATDEKQAARGYSYLIPRWDYMLTGQLRLVLNSYIADRTKFNDGVKQRLEEILDQVLDSVDGAFASERQRDAEREAERADRSRRAVDLAERRYLELLETRRRESVAVQVARWQFLQDLTAYAAHVSDQTADLGAEAEEWLAWVSNHLKTLGGQVRLPGLPADIERDDPKLASALGLDFGSWQAWRTAAPSD